MRTIAVMNVEELQKLPVKPLYNPPIRCKFRSDAGYWRYFGPELQEYELRFGWMIYIEDHQGLHPATQADCH